MRSSDRHACACLGLVPVLLAAAAWTGAASANAGDTPVEMNPRVRAVDIDLEFDPDRGTIIELVTVDIEASGVAELTFRLNDSLTVERARVDAQDVTIEHRKAGDRLTVLLDPAIDGRRRLTFRITGRPRRGRDLLVRADRVVFGAWDRWYPSLDGTWATATVDVRVPEGWTAVAPGRGELVDAGRWRWRSDSPVRHLALVAAPGLALSEGVAVRVPLRVAAPAETDGAAALAPSLESPMSWLSSSLAPYPFDGFNVVVLPGLAHRLRASGMIALPADSLPRGSSDGADLLAGQWFGELLAGDGVWIDAFAAWYATVYARDRSADLPGEIARLRREYFEMSSRRDVPLSRADQTTPAAVVRGKGSAAPDMIRVAVGDRRVDRAVSDLFRAPIAPPRSLTDVRSVFESQAGSTLLRSFADWFDRTGAPQFKTELRTSADASGDWRVELTLVQLRGTYALPVEVMLTGQGKSHREVVRVDEETTVVTWLLPFEPTRVELDPFDKLFQWQPEVN